jgi:hypothetical protein
MVQVCTHDDIIRYVYQETTETENAEVEDAMLADTELLDFYLDCIDLKVGLNKIQLQPSEKTIANILAFSASKNASIFL